MRLERAADSVAENTPTVISSGTALIYCVQTRGHSYMYMYIQYIVFGDFAHVI